MLQRWDKPRLILIGVVLGLELVVGGYFALYIRGLRADQNARASQAQQDLATLRNDAGQLTDLRRQFNEAKLVLSHLEPGTAADHQATYMPTLLSQLQDLARRSGLELDVVNPGLARTPTNPTPPAAPATTGGSSAPAAGAPGATAAPAPPAVPAETQISVTMTLKGTFAQMMTFMNGLETFPKVVTVDSMQIRPDQSARLVPGESPPLNINMDITGTVLPPAVEATAPAPSAAPPAAATPAGTQSSDRGVPSPGTGGQS